MFWRISFIVILDKQTRTPFHQLEEDEKPQNKLDRIYIDHCGSITSISLGENLYLFTITDAK